MTPTSRAALRRPTHHAVAAHPLRSLFAPSGAVVVGASTDPTKLGGVMAASLASYSGHLALVNPRGGPGMHGSVTDAVVEAPCPIDLAVLCVPAAACADVIAECGAVGVRAALVCAGGFAEAGPDGAGHQDRLLEAARSAGIRLLGPNTSGFFAPPDQLLASFVPGVATLRPGPVGVVAASGGLNHALAFALQREGVGLSLGVGIGAGIDVAAPEVLDYLAHDPGTRAIALHLETVTDGPALLAAVEEARRRKPVVAMVVGRHDIGDFARSHTGALATSWRTTRALLRQAGAVLADDVDELVVAASVLARTRARPHATPGAALVTAQAGPGLVVADALHEAGVGLPMLSEDTRAALGGLLPPMTYQANPVDTGRPGPRHAEVITTVGRDPAVEIVGVYAITEPVVDLLAAARPARALGIPVVVAVDGPPDDVAALRRAASDTGTPLVSGPRALAVALEALAEDADLQHHLAHPLPRRQEPAATHRLPTAFSEAAAKDLLDGVGISTPARCVCRSVDQARAALHDLGGRVAAKVSDATVLHKTDLGGVRLGITGADEIEQAFVDLAALGSGEVLVEQLAGPGVDLLVAARRDPVFGPVVVVGLGGTATEVHADVAIAAVPASPVWLAGLADGLQARALLDGHRGSPAVSRDALGAVLAALGDLLLSHPELDEVEINPLRATDDGLVALDAVLLVTGGTSATAAHTERNEHR